MPNRVPKQKRNLTLANLPRDVLEKIHTDLSKGDIKNSMSLARSSKAAALAVPPFRPNKVWYGNNVLRVPPGTHLPGAAEVRELKQRLLFVTRLLRKLRRNAERNVYISRLERYTAFKNTLQEVLETNPGLDTIKKKHVRVEYTLTNCHTVTSLRNFNNIPVGPCEEQIILTLRASSDVIPFELKLSIQERMLTYRAASLWVSLGEWRWIVLGKYDAPHDTLYSEPVNLPMFVKRIRVNQSRGKLVFDKRRHLLSQWGTISLVRLTRLLKKTDPGIRLPVLHAFQKVKEVRNIIAHHLGVNASGYNSDANALELNNNNAYRYPHPYNSSNSDNNRR